jgi:hypothetical protein
MVAIDAERAQELVAGLSSAGHDLDDLAQDARRLLQAAERPSGAPALVEDVAGWARRTAAELSSRVDEIVRLDTVGVVHAAGRRRLHLEVGAVGGLDELLERLAAVGILGFCPPDGQVSGRRAALAALPPDLVAGLVRQAPGVLGGADGVPFAIRDRANRLLLAREVRRLEALGPAADARQRRLLRDLQAWQEDPDLTMVKLDAARGRVVLARGDLDRAGRVAVIVPGAGLTMHGISRRHVGWMDALYRGMGRGAGDAVSRRAGSGDGADPSGAAVVLWLDYDSPAQLVPGAVRRHAATDAARRLPAFLDGLAGVDRELVTTLGHSYGSVVLGRSLADHDARLATDQVVALGSPGMGVQLSRELGLHDDQRLYAATFAEDPIAHVGRWQPVLGDVGRAIHGPDPRRLGAARTIELSTHDLADDGVVERHMQYLEPGSSALGVIADLASGGSRPPG